MIAALLSNGALTVIGRVLALGTTVLAARLLGPAELGHYSVALTLLLLATWPAMAGLPDLMVREVARRSGTTPPRRLWAVVGPALKLAAGITGVLVVAYLAGLVLLAGQLAGLDTGLEGGLALLVVAVVPLFVVRMLAAGVLRGLDRVSLALVPGELLHPALLLILLALLQPQTAFDAFALLGGTVVASALVALVLLARAWPRREPAQPGAPLTRGYLLRSGLPFAAIGMLSLVTQRIDLLVLSGFAAPRELGHYALAAQLALLAQVPLAIANSAIAGQVARAHQRGDRAALAAVMRQVSTALALAGAGGLLAFWLSGHWLIALAFGPGFLAAYPYVLLLLAGQLVQLCCGPLVAFLNLAGHAGTSLRGGAIGAVLALVLSLALVPRFGAYGAAAGSALALAGANLWLAHRFRRALGVRPGLLSLLGPHDQGPGN